MKAKDLHDRGQSGKCSINCFEKEKECFIEEAYKMNDLFAFQDVEDEAVRVVDHKNRAIEHRRAEQISPEWIAWSTQRSPERWSWKIP